MNEEVKTKVQVGSDNVFADLDLPNPEERLIKAELARRISDIIRQKNLTQVRNADALPVVLRRSERQLCAAEILDIDQPKVSALTRGKLSGFSTTRLFRFLNALGNDVEIMVKPKPEHRSSATITVVED